MPIDETLAQTEAPQPSETPTSQTLDYYDANAEAFASSTADVDFSSVQQRFASLLPPGARVLDFCCGSGRDSRYFLKAGFDVTATDGSAELCKIARQLTGLPVRHELFQELSETEAYDGILPSALRMTSVPTLAPRPRAFLKAVSWPSAL